MRRQSRSLRKPTCPRSPSIVDFRVYSCRQDNLQSNPRGQRLGTEPEKDAAIGVGSTETLPNLWGKVLLTGNQSAATQHDSG